MAINYVYSILIRIIFTDYHILQIYISAIKAEARYLVGERKRARAASAAARLPGIRNEDSPENSASPYPLLRAPSRFGAKSAQVLVHFFPHNVNFQVLSGRS